MLALPASAAGQLTPFGSELQINTYTADAQLLGAVAASASGDFFVVWDSVDQDGASLGVFGRLVSSAGAPLTAEIQINTYTTGAQANPSVAASGSGDFVVAWDGSLQDGDGSGVAARLFSSAGVPVTGEIQVNAHIEEDQSHPSVAAAASGDFVVVWQSSDNHDGDGYGLFARRFSSAGLALATEFQVNTYTPGGQRKASVAASASGDFVVVWLSEDQDGSGYGVFARMFSSAGVPLVSEFQVTTYTAGAQDDPAVAAAAASGDFVLVWQSNGQDGSIWGVFARLFSSTGALLSGEFQVNTYTTYSQRLAAVAAEPDGDFLVAWESPQDGSSSSVVARRFSSAGAALSGEQQVNTYTGGAQGFSSVAADAAGGFVVAWDSNGQDGSFRGVFAQRLVTAGVLDVDGNGAVQALSDGLLVLRRFFGLTGVALTSGVIGAGCARCDALAIEPYLAGLGLALDIDGNGSLQALADGLLVVRYLFGLRDAALTGSAVGAGCTRCDAMAIEPYIGGLVQ
jgi:hypothetical protein